MLLAGRVRNEEECSVVQEIIQKHLKRKVIPENIFSLHDNTSATTKPLLELLLKAPLKGKCIYILFVFEIQYLPSGSISQKPFNILFQNFTHLFVISVPWVQPSFGKLEFKIPDFTPEQFLGTYAFIRKVI